MTAISMPTLAERIGFCDAEISERKALLDFTHEDEEELTMFKGAAHEIADAVVEEFYAHQLQIPEIRKMIGDSETLTRLKGFMSAYVARLFSGEYNMDYINSRLRIGKTHARIGIAPKFYVSSLFKLHRIIQNHLMTSDILHEPPASLAKLFLFDLQIVFDTYIQCLLDEVEDTREAVRKRLGTEAPFALGSQTDIKWRSI